MKRYKPFFKFEELRKNPEMNPHIGAWDYVDKYKDDDDVYISFTEIDKIGINPKSKYNTPVGIYTYPLKEFIKDYMGFDTSPTSQMIDNIKFTNSVGRYAPFAGNAKYVNFIRCKDKANFIEDMYKDYGSNDYDRDIKILEDKYKNSLKIAEDSTIISFLKTVPEQIEIFTRAEGKPNLKDLESILRSINLHNFKSTFPKFYLMRLADLIWGNVFIIDSNLITASLKLNNFFNVIVDEGRTEAKEKNPVMMMWNITRLLAEKLSNNAKQASTKWNLILSKDLGYSGFADKSGKGYIHPSEPMQAVFFNTRAFDIIARVENVPSKSKTSEKDIMVRKLMDIMMISDERKEDFEINLLFSKDKKRILRYKGNFRIEKINIKMMPYQIEEIDGSFYAVHSNLTSFINFPIEITGDLYLSKLPYIDSLKGFPEYIYGDLLIDKDLLDIFGETQIRNKSNIKGDVIIYG